MQVTQGTGMLSAYDKDNNYVLAAEVQYDDGPFYCPECHGELILKAGRVKIAHFAHQAYADCSYTGEPESDEHIKAKLEIYKALRDQPGVEKLQVERSLKEVRPDVSFYYDGSYIAIEIQISPITLDEIIRRTTAYTRKNIYVLWAPILSLDMFSGRYAPKDFERNLHRLYEGIVYYWSKGLDLVPTEFEEYTLVGGRYSSWNEKPSKRFVTPQMSPTVSILELSPLKQPRRYPFPAARLWGLPFEEDDDDEG
jgi:competence protein CoiA